MTAIKSSYQEICREHGLVEREEQQALAEDVLEKALQKDSRILITESPTGTGKSLAYLLAALHYAASGKGKVAIGCNGYCSTYGVKTDKLKGAHKKHGKL